MAKMAKKSRVSSLLFTLGALIAIALCIKLGFWQFDRYQIRHALTEQITSALEKSPQPLTSSNQSQASPWMKVTISGKYDAQAQTLLRGHYFQNQYGLEVLTLFMPEERDIPPIWIDRGWIQTDKGANDSPTIPNPPQGTLSLTGILREYDDPAESRGVLFALPAPKLGRIDEVTLQKVFSGETFHSYLKLNSSDAQSPSSLATLDISPLTPPGQGPHLAYAIQWWLFALIIAVTRVALLKSERESL